MDFLALFFCIDLVFLFLIKVKVLLSISIATAGLELQVSGKEECVLFPWKL